MIYQNYQEKLTSLLLQFSKGTFFYKKCSPLLSFTLVSVCIRLDWYGWKTDQSLWRRHWGVRFLPIWCQRYKVCKWNSLPDVLWQKENAWSTNVATNKRLFVTSPWPSKLCCQGMETVIRNSSTKLEPDCTRMERTQSGPPNQIDEQKASTRFLARIYFM